MENCKITPLSEKGRCEYCGEQCNICDWITDGLCQRCLKFQQALKNFCEEEVENICNKMLEITGMQGFKKSFEIEFPEKSYRTLIRKLQNEVKLKHFGELAR